MNLLSTCRTVCVALAATTLLALPGTAQQSSEPVYWKDFSFGVPFDPINRAESQRLQEVQLNVSTDRGQTWRHYASERPDAGMFRFTARQDGEYWFVVRTLDREQRLYPPSLNGVAPGLKVIVDTVPPQLKLKGMPPQGDQLRLAWEAYDDHLEEGSLRLDYRGRDSGDWQPISVAGRPAGDAQFRPIVSGVVEVRGRIRDRAGNEASQSLLLSSGGVIAPQPQSGPMTSTGPTHGGSSGSFIPAPTIATGGAEQFQLPAPPSLLNNSAPTRPMVNPQVSSQTQASITPFGNPASEPLRVGPSTSNPNPGVVRRPPLERPSTLNLKLVNSTRFHINYVAEQVGKSGLGSVKMWYTTDGRTWNLYGEDEDHVSPFEIEVGGEGTYGFSLQAESGAGVGDDPPAPGDPPQVWIEVDLTPPVVQLGTPVAGQGAQAGQLTITWSVQDANLAPRSISVFYSDRGDGPWTPIVENIENTGKYQWKTTKDVPYKLYIRVEAKDRAGNLGRADTLRPVFIDLSRPRLRVTTVEPTSPLTEPPK